MKTVYELIKSTPNLAYVNKYEPDGFGDNVTTMTEIKDATLIEQIAKNKPNGVCYLIHPGLVACDGYDEDCTTERENIHLFLETIKETKDIKHITGAYNYEAIAVDINCEEESIIEMLKNVCAHPAING